MFGISVFGGVSYILQTQTLRQVQEKSDAIMTMLSRPESIYSRQLITFPEGENFLVQIVNSRGEVINISSGFTGRPLPMKMKQGKGIMVADNHPYAYVCRPIDLGRGETGYVLVAQSLKQASGFLESLGKTLFLAGAIGISLALAGGYFIARRALKPVGEITVAARSIGSGDLSRRIPLSGPEDELYSLADTFNSMLERLERSFKKQKDFLADASHEFRTPVTVIEGYTRMLDRWGKNDPAMVNEALEAISRETVVMKKLIDQMLMLARADEGTDDEHIEDVEIMDILAEVYSDALALAGDIRVELEQAPSVKVKVKPMQFKQAIMVLVDNAIKYNRPGGSVTIGADRSGDKVIIKVEDTGMGIPEGEIPNIFDRFYRADKARSRKLGGTGLGLAIAKSIVEIHGGSIHVKSRVGEGTVFSVEIPTL